MSRKLDALKKRLLKQFEERLDEMLDGVDEDQLHIGEIEDIALRARSEMGRIVTQELVNEQTVPQVPGPQCPKCQQEMHYKGRKKKKLETRSGLVEVERAYYYGSPWIGLGDSMVVFLAQHWQVIGWG